MLTFDAPTHTYRWNGEKVSGVTSHLQTLHSFAGVPLQVLEDAQRRGTYVHRMTELWDLGQLDEEANAQVQQGRFVGYLRAWKDFVADHEPNWTDIEEMGFSATHLYAGMWDRAGRLNRRRPGNWTLDVKTSKQPHWVWGLQLAAYRQIRAEREPMAALDRRASVQLHADGSYDFIEWTDPTDWPVFHALLTLNRRAQRERAS